MALWFLGWQSLEERRRKQRLTTMYKIINGEIDIPSDRFLTPVARRSRHNNSKSYIIPHARTQFYKNSFFPRTITEWNRLPENTVQALSTEAFKNQLELQ